MAKSASIIPYPASSKDKAEKLKAETAMPNVQQSTSQPRRLLSLPAAAGERFRSSLDEAGSHHQDILNKR
jgi:hypothetical protein